MGVLSRVHAPGRYANLRRIRSLDPEVDHDAILRLTARFDFPWDYSQGTGIAFMRDYGVPSIAAVLDRTREFEDHGTKRYDDTILIGDEATLDGIDSPRSYAALRRLNRIHGHYDIPTTSSPTSSPPPSSARSAGSRPTAGAVSTTTSSRRSPR
jgi:hypothetical protein